MHFVEYGDGRSTEKVESVYHQDTVENTVSFERTEDLPEQKEDSETKKTFKENGGVASITNASLLQSEEITVMNTQGGKRLSMKNNDSVVGLYSVDEEGNNKIIINEDGEIPELNELSDDVDELKELVSQLIILNQLIIPPTP